MDCEGDRFTRQLLTHVEPYFAKKSAIEKVNYLENLLDIGENFASNLYREENSRKKLLGSLQLKVVLVVLCRLVQLLEESFSFEDGHFSKQLVVSTQGTSDDQIVTLEKFQALRRRFRTLQEISLLRNVSFAPLAEESIACNVVKSFYVNANSVKVSSNNCRSYLSFLQLPEPQKSSISAFKVEGEVKGRTLLRKRRGEKSSDSELTHHVKDSNEILTTELLSLTKQLKSGSSEVYEALKRDQERLEKLADVVDNNLSQTGKQLRLTEQFGIESRKTKWHVWVIISLLPLLWILVYLTIRFH
ncbi:hypothetical protein GpartN1_g550.t1 [Galdieria partita]|uniref:Vesicle transport protein USE1 n=1 Tax=Galdieria partita TaxID=83374 RepID=A0A9C7PQW2_9RHOD|nr:hypothetical protein GpartN1_g550.t1 [Galdieria partita]